jgi:hypothetical protein
MTVTRPSTFGVIPPKSNQQSNFDASYFSNKVKLKSGYHSTGDARMMRECLVTDRARPALAHFEMYQSAGGKRFRKQKAGIA